ncbi:MAG: isoleucine--tRNA ligase [Planctomycetota bacterium]|nr:MAG: isoleucine--tRNA ligase [Planctomycetota bacterium]
MFEPLSRQYLHQPDAFERQVLEQWQQEDLLAATEKARAGAEAFVFYEGPPTANGRPGIHHVLARTLKDAVCRFWTMRGRRVERKAGWDTHGLPVELEVEKQLGISGKPEIEAMGIGPFNQACRDSVFTYKEEWEKLSERIGYWLDYQNPYVTFHKPYVESLWFLLSRFAANDLLYRGNKVLPWCGRCGTGLSSHEVGQGYRDLEDPSVWVSFPLLEGPERIQGAELVAWTTTPWTLPSNMAACVHPEFDYALVQVQDRRFLLLEEKAAEVFGEDAYQVTAKVSGSELAGLAYQPLFEIDADAMRVLHGGHRRHVVVADDFVSAEEGTGIVHMAPYGADDFRIGVRDDLVVALAVGEDGRFLMPLGEVDAGTFFKDADKALLRDLKARGRLVKRTQYRHPYPHCWRCDTPLLYFPAPAWFLRTTAFKQQMLEANRRIRWSPEEIGSGRFGEWLENNVDWALSRDRYWGTPLPVWVNEEDPEDWLCLASFQELAELCGGLPSDFDPHRPMVDELTFPTPTPGKSGTMRRVRQVIDCWFDSGAMPLAQHHWPFENRERVQEQFPADFICEGLDQTRGWFYTLHAISTFLTCVDEELWQSGELWGQELPRLQAGGAYRSVMVNGLVLDEQGQKMSKRLGNAVDPWKALEEHGADSIRWNLLGSGAAHLSKRFSGSSVAETRRRVLGTLGACYEFFSLYARIESWNPAGRPPAGERPPLDRWILSRTSSTASGCLQAWENLEPANALRALETLVVEDLSNWYIRRSRRRFWGGEGQEDQNAAFATLYEVLHAVVRMCAPVAPFLSDALWRRLLGDGSSVHLAAFPDPEQESTPGCENPIFGVCDSNLEAAMDPILRAASLGRSIRERLGLRVRQPLSRLVIHLVGESDLHASPRAYSDVLRQELNVKEVQWIDGVPDFVQVRAKPNYPRLGKRAGKDMKALAKAIAELSRETLFQLQGGESLELAVEDRVYSLESEDVLLETLSVEGVEAESDGRVTLGLFTELNDALRLEGVAREVINRVNTQRKDMELEVTDRVRLRVSGSSEVEKAVEEFRQFIAEEVLAEGGVEWVSEPSEAEFRTWSLPDGASLMVALESVDALAS